MQVFRLAITGDFLDTTGRCAYDDTLVRLLQDQPHVCFHFLDDQVPRTGDSAYWVRFYSLEVTPEHIADVDGLVCLRPWVTRRTFARGPGSLTFIGRSGAGYDKVDLEACSENDVAVFNAPLALNHPTASAALLLMLALAKRLKDQERITRQGRWDLQAEVLGAEIQGRTLGIIGLGHSGRELVRLVAPFEMQILAYSPHADRQQAVALGVRLASLEEVFLRADFVSVHCRLNTETRQLIGAPQLRMMKPTAYFINVARGELVDQAALVAALGERRIAGAGLDVFAEEPPPLDDPLFKLDNVILTPHWLASTKDVWQATGRGMALSMLRAARGEVPENIVNTDVLARPGFQKKLRRFAENRQADRKDQPEEPS